LFFFCWETEILQQADDNINDDDDILNNFDFNNINVDNSHDIVNDNSDSLNISKSNVKTLRERAKNCFV